MINPGVFLNFFKNSKVNFFTGVPDSLLKNFLSYVEKKVPRKNHIIATNEGSAIGLAIGHYLSTKNLALVYMQNSGLNNALNPIISLADRDVYGIPMILLIGWRGELDNKKKQIKDEPQHRKQGKITLQQLKLAKIPYRIIDSKSQNLKQTINYLIKISKTQQGPAALIIKKNTFSKFKNYKSKEIKKLPSREAAIKEIVNSIPRKTIIISTTGMISRELYEIRKNNNFSKNYDFYCVGGMGHASQIAAGIALNFPRKKILCLDGDGSLLMHMGSLAINAQFKNLTHIILNNAAHDSVGGQPTLGNVLSFEKIGKNCGYKNTKTISSISSIKSSLKKLLNIKNSSLLVIKCLKGYRSNLGRPKENLYQRKKIFIQQIRKNK